MRAVVVTPTYNERYNIGPMIRGLRAAHDSLDIIVVDDGSPDGTAQVVRELAQEFQRITLIERSGKLGLASAYVAGFEQALQSGYDTIVQMDADLSHDPADVPRLLSHRADLVLGSRYVPGGGTRNWPMGRRALSRFGSIYARRILGLEYKDLTGGFKAWSQQALRHVLNKPVGSDGYVFQVEMTLRAVDGNFDLEEVPIIFTERTHGQSKMSMNIALEAAFRVPMLRFR